MSDTKRVALVTGASSGIGRETAILLAKEGYEVIGAARRMDRLTELAGQVEGIRPVDVDLSDTDDLEKFCEHISGLPEPVTALINNAGYSLRGALEDVSIEAARRMFQVNVFALMRITQACLPGMRKMRGGTIVNLSSMAGKFAFPGSGPYAATKHAVEAITDALRVEVRPFGIRVVTIRPGFIATEFNDVANTLTGDLFARTDPDYKPVYETSGKAIGSMFAGVTVPGPELIAGIVAEAVLSDSPRIVYHAGLFSEEFLGKRAGLDDEGFDEYLSDMTGLKDLKL
ncbi:MAG TPA: SDR family NAD(P)-dependent oxidoreductase [Deltaproteobacteria bacterium]|nr:SDR family NAD(P)-dependent oxidoreductase [Deltaproteobacteria bacterium]